MTGRQRAIGLTIIGALALVVATVGVVALPLLVDATLAADYSLLPAGTEVVMTKEQYDRGQMFPLWGAAFLTALIALAVAIFVVALRWPRPRTASLDR